MNCRASPGFRVAGCAALVALGLLLGSCGKASDPQNGANTGANTAPQASAPSPAQPSLPAATKTPPSATDGGTANANDPPMKSMSKEEEAKSMPRPGQANDHSTLAKDPKN
jgi:hypothetical protein